jgi:hypothetical protein
MYILARAGKGVFRQALVKGTNEGQGQGYTGRVFRLSDFIKGKSIYLCCESENDSESSKQKTRDKRSVKEKGV